LLVCQRLGRERPNIAERHRTESCGLFSGRQFQIDMDVKERDAIESDAAEFDGSAVAEIFECETDIANCAVRENGERGASFLCPKKPESPGWPSLGFPGSLLDPVRRQDADAFEQQPLRVCLYARPVSSIISRNEN